MTNLNDGVEFDTLIISIDLLIAETVALHPFVKCCKTNQHLHLLISLVLAKIYPKGINGYLISNPAFNPNVVENPGLLPRRAFP